MIILPSPMFDFSIESVNSRGVPNLERVIVRVNFDTVTTNLGMMIGFRNTDRSITPLNDRMLWLGSGNVKRGSTINVYTGHGESKGYEAGNGTYTYNLFWGLNYVAFDRIELEPILFRLGDTCIGELPKTNGILGFGQSALGYQGPPTSS